MSFANITKCVTGILSISNSLSVSLFSYVYCNKDRSNEWVLREKSQKAVHDVEKFLRGHLARLTRGLVRCQSFNTSSELRIMNVGEYRGDVERS